MAAPHNRLFLSTLARRQRLKKFDLHAPNGLHATLPNYRAEALPRRGSPASMAISKIATGLLLSGAISWLAYRRKSLSRSGIGGAVVAGTTIFSTGGWTWASSMIFFFITSSLLSHWKEQEKASTANDKFSKGSQRDLGQVASNGGVATLLALAHGLSQKDHVRQTLEAGYVGALATATADTWGTEVGVLSSQQPRLITTGKITTAGTSGGITLIGTGASAAGGLALGSIFWLLKKRQRASSLLPLIALISGLVGSLFDSLLGATAQAMYYCPACHKETEKRIHSCGTTTRHVRGLPWMDNDQVNLLATLSGSLVAMLLRISLNRQTAVCSQQREHASTASNTPTV
jgi:uncharacterized protein (TIGR00297 family)